MEDKTLRFTHDGTQYGLRLIFGDGDVSWLLTKRGIQIGYGWLIYDEREKAWGVHRANLNSKFRGKRLYPKILTVLRADLGPILSDYEMSDAAVSAWEHTQGASYDDAAGRWRLNPRKNPPQHWPVMSYSAASRYEPMAKARNVSAVARSGRGFMRAYEKAGSWAALDPWWKNRRDNFVSRHMAQVRQRSEKLWKNGFPSRRALALIMWAYMPPGKNTKSNPLYRTGRHILYSREAPEGRSNKVRYFLKGHEKPWRGGRGGFGPEWDEVFDLSKKQAARMLALRNPRGKSKVVRMKVGRRTLELVMYKRSR